MTSRSEKEIHELHEAWFGTASTPGAKVAIDRNTRFRESLETWKWVIIIGVAVPIIRDLVVLIK